MMTLFLLFLLVLFDVNNAVNETEHDFYKGEKFPIKYLDLEDNTPTMNDVDMYLKYLERVVSFLSSEPNTTDINVAITLFFMRGVLRRTILDDGRKFKPSQLALVSQLLKASDSAITHYVYSVIHSVYTMRDTELMICQLLQDDVILSHSLPDFNKKKLERWLFSEAQINDFLEDMDTITLPKDDYALVTDYSTSELNYNIKIYISDTCLSRVAENFPPQPQNKALHPCKPDPFCSNNIHAEPSIGYGLSHRLLNMFMYRNVRRCYWVSPASDELHIDHLCAHMYRETVYLARRGYFARDLFLEHVALCGMNGYLEFYRQHWFRKAIQWIDEDGCVFENHNFLRNRTARRLENTYDEKKIKKMRKHLRSNLNKQCHSHPMGLLTIVLSNALRHAMHYIKLT